MEKMKNRNSNQLTCNKEKKELSADMLEQCIADSKKDRGVITTRITKLHEEKCESQKKDDMNKMKLKHKEEIDKLRNDIFDDHKQQTGDIIDQATDKCNNEKAEFK